MTAKVPLRAVPAALLLLLAACAYQQPAGNLVTQQLTWISYLNGDDIRAQCADGAPDRYRLVYNANRNRHSRTYDVWDVREGAVIEQSVDRGIVFEPGRAVTFSNIGVPERASVNLSREELAELEARMEASGVFDPPPVGLRLASRGFYWIVSGCRDGRFFLTGFRHPSDDFDRIQFASFLEERDRTGVRYPVLPGTAMARSLQRCPRGRGSSANNDRCFWVEIGDNGLVGVRTVN